MATLTATGVNESYLYDADGARVKKVSGSTTTYYPFPHYEVSGGTATKYYFFAGQRVAMKQGSGSLVYLNGDHLSSTALATTNTGAFLERQGYYGYGKYRTGGVLPTDNRYTGQKLDAATGLYYYGARYYDRNIGQFVSPDTLVPDPTNVWDYNRYAYGRLNPLKYNDPSGHTVGRAVHDSNDGPLSPLWEEWQSSGQALTYDQFVIAQKQYTEYLQYPELYLIDLQMEFGEMAGDRKAAGLRTTNATLYANYVLHKELETALIQGSALGVNDDGSLVAGAIVEGASQGFRGGAYGRIRGAPGLYAHHMPAKSISPLTEYSGPAIQMEWADHIKTSSYGNSAAARAYRQELQRLVDSGNMRDAMSMEIRDIQRVAGGKYNDAIFEMLDYARISGYLDKK